MNNTGTQPLSPALAGGSTALQLAKPRVRPTFSEELGCLARLFAKRPATLEGIIAGTQGRGYDLLLVLICLPFLTPVPLMGLSTPFGLVVSLIGARLALGRQPWLPNRLLQRELPHGFIAKVFAGAIRIVRTLEILLRPRLSFLHEQLVFRRLSGGLIMVSGLLLLLPLPIPLTNSFPALTVVLLAAGAMERDGLFFCAGCATFTGTLAYFGLLAFGGVHLLDNLRHSVFGI